MKKKIFLDTDNRYYCYVYVLSSLNKMRQEAHKSDPRKKHSKCLGLCHPFELRSIKTDRVNKLIANVFLCSNQCGAGIVTHELLHACLWAWRFKKGKEQYPIVINNMAEEEDLLHNHTYAVKQFYNWFFETYRLVGKSYKLKS